MRIIVWVGAALVGALGVAALVANAAPGDVVYSTLSANTILSGAQKTALASWINQVMPSYNAASLRSFYCWRYQGAVGCNGEDVATISLSDYADAVIAGTAPELESQDGSDATYRRKLADVSVTGAALSNLAAIVLNICGLGDPSVLRAFGCERRGKTTDVMCRCEYLVTASPADFGAAMAADQVVRVVGRVE